MLLGVSWTPLAVHQGKPRKVAILVSASVWIIDCALLQASHNPISLGRIEEGMSIKWAAMSCAHLYELLRRSCCTSSWGS